MLIRRRQQGNDAVVLRDMLILVVFVDVCDNVAVIVAEADGTLDADDVFVGESVGICVFEGVVVSVD